MLAGGEDVGGRKQVPAVIGVAAQGVDACEVGAGEGVLESGDGVGIVPGEAVGDVAGRQGDGGVGQDGQDGAGGGIGTVGVVTLLGGQRDVVGVGDGLGEVIEAKADDPGQLDGGRHGQVGEGDVVGLAEFVRVDAEQGGQAPLGGACGLQAIGEVVGGHGFASPGAGWLVARWMSATFALRRASSARTASSPAVSSDSSASSSSMRA